VTQSSLVSIIAPMLNEAGQIDRFVTDVANQDFAGDVEVIVADGGSIDGSVERLEAAARRRGLALTVLENPSSWVSQGLNACINRARGDLLVRLDCHSRYPSDYLRRCVLAAEEESDALVVGGVIVAEGRTAMERAVACAMDSPFGGIGFYRLYTDDGHLLKRLAGAVGLRSARNGHGARRADSDTTTFGAFRPEAFSRVGLFDESLRRNQDDEFNLRVRLAGGRIVVDPSIRVHYTPRGSLQGVFRQYHEYGLWKVPVMLKHGQLSSPRSFAPLVFVSTLVVLAPTAVLSRAGRRVLAVELGAYAALAFASAGISIRGRRESWSLLPRVVTAFPAFHTGYGIGMLRGWARAAALTSILRQRRPR
jgi:glycosyltransferase involved in cell wall biosynthesis